MVCRPRACFRLLAEIHFLYFSAGVALGSTIALFPSPCGDSLSISFLCGTAWLLRPQALLRRKIFFCLPAFHFSPPMRLKTSAHAQRRKNQCPASFRSFILPFLPRFVIIFLSFSFSSTARIRHSVFSPVHTGRLYCRCSRGIPCVRQFQAPPARPGGRAQNQAPCQCLPKCRTT